MKLYCGYGGNEDWSNAIIAFVYPLFLCRAEYDWSCCSKKARLECQLSLYHWTENSARYGWMRQLWKTKNFTHFVLYVLCSYPEKLQLQVHSSLKKKILNEPIIIIRKTVCYATLICFVVELFVDVKTKSCNFWISMPHFHFCKQTNSQIIFVTY